MQTKSDRYLQGQDKSEKNDGGKASQIALALAAGSSISAPAAQLIDVTFGPACRANDPTTTIRCDAKHLVPLKLLASALQSTYRAVGLRQGIWRGTDLAHSD